MNYKKFKIYAKHIEKNGITLHRGYGTFKIELYKSIKGLFDSPWIKTCFNYWKDVFYNFTHIFSFNSRICMWDYYDMYSYLIINLTIKGMYFAYFGTSTIHKKQAHECWMCREKLLKSYHYEDYAFFKDMTIENYKNIIKAEYKADKDCFSYLGKEIKSFWD